MLRGTMTENKNAHYDKRLGWTMEKGIGKGITGDKKGLTPKQHKFLQQIQSFISANGYSPSYEELKQLTGLKSKSNVHSKMHALKRRGYLDFLPHSSRSMYLL